MFFQHYQKIIVFIIVGILVTIVNFKPFNLRVESLLIGTTANSVNAVIFQPPPDEPRPDNTSGAGSRQGQQCPQDQTLKKPSQLSQNQEPNFMIGLVPSTGYGLTVFERPTFWIYLPKTSAKEVVLNLQEDGINYHGQSFIPVSGNAGIVGLKVKDDIPALELEKWYKWSVVLVCGEKPNLNDPVVMAWVRRVNRPTVLSQQQTDWEQAVFYGQQGIWYDTLTALAKAKQAEPNNNLIRDAWVNLLQSVDLEIISREIFKRE